MASAFPDAFSSSTLKKLDDKGRANLPKEWLIENGHRLKLMLSANGDYKVIRCYTIEAYVSILDKIRADEDATYAEITDYISGLSRLTKDSTVGAQQKFVVPKSMRDYIKVKELEHLYLVGCGGHFELWHPDDYDKFNPVQFVKNSRLNEKYKFI